MTKNQTSRGRPEPQNPSPRKVGRGEKSSDPAGPGSADTGAMWPLAEAKLAAPGQREGIVERPRILRVLDAGADAALTLVAAPAGSGKSTAVRAWCAGRSSAQCWVTLDARDDDPLRLWTYVATAVDRVLPGVGRAAIGRLRADASLASPIDELLNGIRASGGEFVLVLDDLHTVTDDGCLESIGYAIEHLPREGTPDRAHAHRPGAETSPPACARSPCGAARGGTRIHARGGAGAARRTQPHRSRRGGGRAALRAHRGLAGRAGSCRPLASRGG